MLNHNFVRDFRFRLNLNGGWLALLCAYVLSFPISSFANQTQTISTAEIVTHLIENKKLSEHDVRVYLAQLKQAEKLDPPLLSLYADAPSQVCYVLSEIAQKIPIDDTLSRGQDYLYDLEKMLAVAYLAAKDKLLLTKNLFLSANIDRDTVRNIAILGGVDPTLVTKASASSPAAYRITPLFESVSFTLYDRNEQDKVSIEYKQTDSLAWEKGLDLQWDRTEHSFSGSIVYLQEQTEYQLRVTVTAENGAQEVTEYEFATWDSLPPFDPNKTYYLSDIYSGGQLDLDAMQIEGTEDAWVRIIGDNSTPIIADSRQYDAAINIGSRKYIYFENITIIGGRLQSVASKESHSIWFNGCDISGYGRTPNYIIEGLAYENDTDRNPINYDSAFILRETGRVVIENCKIHSPVPYSNNWGVSHPNGPNAFLAMANHPDFSYEGQIVIRNNRIFGTNEHRFNDVIESRSNGNVDGGFVRDSAIYNNYLAYANDDIIELDGGQNNVLFYDNEIEQAYVGISLIPNRKGPSYVFNNYIHNLGDDRDKEWGVFKVGGLVSRPEGTSNIFSNLVRTSANGVTSSRYDGDYTFWVNAINNVMVHDKFWDYMGYGIYDRVYFEKSQFINNYMFNLQANRPVYQANNVIPFFDPKLENHDFAMNIWQNPLPYIKLPIPEMYRINNFDRVDDNGEVIIGAYTQDKCEMTLSNSEILAGATNTNGKGSAKDLTTDNALAQLVGFGEIDDEQLALNRSDTDQGLSNAEVISTDGKAKYKEVKVTNSDSKVYIKDAVDFYINNNNPCGTAVEVVNAKRGVVNTHDGDDSINIVINSNSPDWSNLFSINSQSGDDYISLTETNNSQYSSFYIDAGVGNDLINLSEIAAPYHPDEVTRTIKGGDGQDILVLNNTQSVAISGFEVLYSPLGGSLLLTEKLLADNTSNGSTLVIYGFDVTWDKDLQATNNENAIQSIPNKQLCDSNESEELLRLIDKSSDSVAEVQVSTDGHSYCLLIAGDK